MDSDEALMLLLNKRDENVDATESVPMLLGTSKINILLERRDSFIYFFK